MSGTESQIDANFYRLIHQWVSRQASATPSERRGRQRQPFLASQRIAPVDGTRFPDKSEFISVRCYDLTRAGFSFFMSTPPPFRSLVAEFGQPPDVIYVGATVQRCSNVLVHSSGLVEPIEGRASHVGYRTPEGEYVVPMVLVGCGFTERLEKPAAADGSAEG